MSGSLYVASEVELLDGLNERLHEMSQPMTVLLCLVEYGGSLDDVAEMKHTFYGAREACGRLRETVNAMQLLLKHSLEEGQR